MNRIGGNSKGEAVINAKACHSDCAERTRTGSPAQDHQASSKRAAGGAESSHRAGWHTSVKLRVPDHVHLLFLPPYSPELQPAEHLWPLTNAALVNEHFATIEDLEDTQFARCAALQRQRDRDRNRSTTLFQWWPKQIHKSRGPRRN